MLLLGGGVTYFEIIIEILDRKFIPLTKKCTISFVPYNEIPPIRKVHNYRLRYQNPRNRHWYTYKPYSDLTSFNMHSFVYVHIQFY